METRKAKRQFIFILLVTCLILSLFLCACQLDNNDSEKNDNLEIEQNEGPSTPIINVRYDYNFLSLNEAKALFAPSFNPLLPKETLLYGDYEASDSCPANYLLSEEGNYYISLNNPLKEFRSEQPIYEAYTISVTTPALLKDPDFYGVSSNLFEDLTHKGVWLNADFFLEFFEGKITVEEAKAFEVVTAYLNYNEKDNELAGYGIQDSPNNMVSFITYNAYTDKIKADYESNQYPRNKKYVENENSYKQTIVVEDVEVALSVVEWLNTNSRDMMLKMKDSFPHLEVEELGIINTFCTADFKIDGINYSISYPLMNRLINVNSQDYGTTMSTDYSLINDIAKSSMSYIIADFLKTH